MIRLTAVIEMEGKAPRALTHESNSRQLVIGRDNSADFAVPLTTISRRHARISETDNVYVVEDLGSTHGTLVNGKKLGKGEKRVLRNGDVIELTKARITCTIESDKVMHAEPGEGTQAIAARAVQGILGRLGEAKSEGPYLRVLNGPDEGMRFPFSSSLTEWTLGRSKDAEFVLNDPNVSRRHAQVKKDWNGFSVIDLGSKNGVLVNDQAIRKPRRLRDRDEIIIGPVKLVYIDPDAELMAALSDVPGFEGQPEEEDEPVVPMGGDPSHLGAPGDAGFGGATGALDVSGGLGGEAGDGEILEGDIDPTLLEPASSKVPFEWIVIGAVGVLIVGAAVMLIAVLI
ncbi:MAG: FHA domain-containing protein [Myxococcota bacterium]